MVRKLFAKFIFLQQTWTKNLLMFADINIESLDPIQPDVTGASLVVPPLQIETSEKV